MPVTVNHGLTATTPDDPNYEIQVKHWNSAHVAIMSATAGSEVFGAFSNGGNVSFGIDGGGFITGSANVTAAPSPVNVTGANGSSVNAQTIAFNNANGMTLGVSTAANGATVTGSYTVPSTAGLLSAVNVSAGTTSNNLSAVTFNNSNGVSFGLNGSVITATVATNYQSQGAYLTTARASNDAIGLNTAQSNVTWTVNSSGLSLDARGYAGTATTFNGTNASASMTLNSAGMRLDLSAAAAAGGFTGGVSTGGNTSGQTGSQTGSIFFAGGNNITLSVGTAVGGAQTITISGANAGGAQTGISGIIAGTQTQTSGTLSFANGNGISFGLSNSSILTASYTVPSTAGLLSAINVSAGTTSGNVSAVTFANGNGLTFGLNAGTITASHNGLTTARASNDGVGLATAQTNVTWTVNSAGLSLNAAGYAGTATSNTGGAAFTLNNAGLAFNGASLAGTTSGFTGANISATITHNTAGLALSMSVAAPGGGATPAASASNGSFTFSTLGFSNANNVTFGTSAGGIITASVAAPGAAAENNWVNLLGANTAGNTTASGSTIGYSGINLTLSGTNGSVVNISAPATSSLVGTNGITLSTNGSTVSIGAAASSYFDNMNGEWPNSTTMQMLQSTSHVQHFFLDGGLSFGVMRIPMSASVAPSSTAATTGNTQFSYGQTRSHNFVIYSRGAGASSQSLISVASTQLTDRQSINVSAAANSTQFSYTNRATYQMSTGEKGFTFDYSSSAASLNFHTSGMTGITGLKMMEFPWSTSLAPGQYWLAYGVSTSTASQFTNVGTKFFNVFSNYGMSQPNLQFGTIGDATQNSVGPFFGNGSFTTAGGSTTSIFPISAVTTSSAHNKMFFQVFNIA